MSLKGEEALILGMDYTEESLLGAGALKGQDGFSPVIKENENNSDTEYRLDIETKEETFTTPNLMGTGGGGEEPLVVDFRYKSNGEGYEAYNFTHTNAEIIEAINNDRTVIMKGLINTARDYAPYIFQLHTYMKNSGRYEFVYNTFSNYMEITEYKLNIYTNDNLEFLVNTYKVNQTIPEIPYGDEGQFISFDEEGNLIAVDAPSGGEEPTLVSFVYESTDNNTWTVHSVDKTYTEIKTALSENKRVIAKGTNKNARLDNPWYFYPNEYYDSAGNWVVFERVNVNGSVIEAFKFTVNGDGTATLVETEVSPVNTSEFATMSDLDDYVVKDDLSDYQNILIGTKGQFVGFDDTGKALAVDVDLSYADFSSISGITDINNLKTDGIYNFSSAITNSPPNMDRYTLEVFTWYRYVVQRAFGFKASTTSSATNSRPTYYVRMYDTMLYSWTSWSLISGSVAVDGALSSASNNPISNKAVYYALADKQDNLAGKGTAGQFVSFSDEGEVLVTEDFPVFARVQGSTAESDSRIEITSTSLIIKQHFRRAKVTLTSTLPSTGSGNLGGRVVVELYRVADGTYKCFSTCSPVINTNSANVVTVYNFAASVSVSEQSDGTLKITSSAGGGMYGLNIQTGTTNPSGSGGAGGNFNDILVWF